MLSPTELIEKLAALVPPPRTNLIRYGSLLPVDMTCCPACGGTMKIIAAITTPASIRKVLDAPGLPSRAPAIAPAR